MSQASHQGLEPGVAPQHIEPRVDVGPDGRFVGLIADDADYLAGTGNTEMRIILNWFEELKRNVQAK